MDVQLKRYYRKKMSGGRSLLARATDFILLRAALLIVVFILMLQWSHSLTVSIPVAVLITAAFSIALILVRRKKADKIFKKDMQRIREKCLLESLTLMNSREYADYMVRLFPGLIPSQDMPGGFLADYKEARVAVLHNHPNSDCTVSQILDAYRLCKNEKKTIMISLSAFTEDAAKFAENAGIKLVPGKEVLRIAGEKDMLPDEHSAEEQARQEMEDTIVSMERVKRSAFSKTKVRAYIICGLVTMIWPLVGGWRFYYPIISSLCFILAIVSYKRGKHSPESADIDLT